MMTKKNDKKFLSSSSPISQTPNENPDIKLVTDCLYELNIARKATLLYPLEHRQVKHSTKQACNQLELVFAITPEFSLGVTAGTLIYSGETLDPDNRNYKDLALSLNNHGIVILKLLKGLHAKELAHFFAMLPTPADQLKDEGGIVHYLTQNGINHIQVTLIDYNQFRVTEEDEINRTQSTKTSSYQNVWRDFAIQLMDNPSSQAFPTGIVPQKVAQLLNTNPEKVDSILKKYEHMVNSYFNETQYDQLNVEDSNTLDGINRLLQELNPHLRQQFLNATLYQCVQASEKQQTYQFISQLSQDLILEMLHQANKRKGPISESFMHLIQKIGPTINENDINPSINNTLELIDSTKNQYLELFNQEDYGKYIDQDYDSTLRQLSSRCPINKDNAEKISEKVEDFNRSNLNLHILRAFKSLMENCVVPDEYNDYAAKIIEIAKENIKRKNYEYAFEAIAVFHQHNSSEKPEEIAQAARKALSQLTDSKLLEDLIQTLDDPKTKLPPAIDSLLNAIGPKIVSPLVKRFIQGGYGEKQHSVLNILKHFKKESVAAAHQLVEHDNVEKIKKLIFLIRQIDDRASSAYLRSLVAHANRSVSREALAALLYFTDPWGIIFLRDQLNSKNSDDMTQAITISGDYHVIEMVPHLIAYLKYNALSKTDIRNNRNLIIALGKIGDTAALPHLEKMIRSAWSIYRSNLKQLKIDIFNSLNNYPIDKIEPLVMLGNKIKDKYINQICNQLSHKTIITPSASGTSSASISKHTPTQDD